MGHLENEIVGSLTALSDEEGRDCPSMFVFPLSLMVTSMDVLHRLDTTRCGEVVRIERRTAKERERSRSSDDPKARA